MPTELPIACTLTPDAIANRKADLLPGLIGRAELVEETDDGWRIRFRPDDLPAIAHVVDAERQCCRFLRFQIVVEPDGGPVWLTLGGPPGTREFLAGLLNS